MAKLTASNYN